MFKKSRKTEEPPMGANSSETEEKGSWFKENQRPIIAVALIVIMAFVMRFVFAFGISADSAFALSGGAVASEHLHTITEIMNGGAFFGEDGSLNYPFGSVNSNPVFIDAILAGIAMIGTALGMATVKAASLTLATFSLVCGTAAVIPAFLLGKEIIGTKKAGFVAALFMAFCPVVIANTVFSNGTETGWILLLFLILLLLVFKGLKSIVFSTHTGDSFKEVIVSNRSAVRMAAIAGLVLALIVLSTSDFRPIVLLLIVSMAVMTAVGRFMYRETRMVALYFSIIIVIGMAVASAYYIPAKLWDQVLSGILILSVATVVLCLTFAMLQRKPWVVTVPAYLIGIIVALVLLSTFVPELYGDIIKGNTEYASAIVGLTGASLSISHLSTDFGVVTLWATIPIIGIMIWKLPKNISSIRYQFLLIFMIFSVYMSSMSDVLATIFSPVYAIGFAYLVMWIFDHVDFKTYFTMIKNAEFKTAWKKVLKPVPFFTIILIVILLCVPMGMYAVDASISTNESDDYDGLQLGALGYYVKTADAWPTGSVLSEYSDVNKSGALVTWLDYSADASTLGGFDVITDMQGNGAEAASNILLSNAVDGSSSGAMLIYLLSYTGLNDTVKGLLTGAGMTAAQYEGFADIINNPSNYKADMLKDPDTYGILRSDVSDENVKYICGVKYLSDNFDAFTISKMYSAVANNCGKNISYFMVDGSMFPIYYGYSSLFNTIGYVNGYATTDDYGTIGQFLTVDYYTMYYTGVYGYTDAMYNTLLWRAYIGMSPAEAGFTSGTVNAYQYFTKLMLSDGEYKAEPGYGLSNYTVDYSSWYVMYNPDSDATLSSDGWTKTLYTVAVDKQEKEGGLINYLSGLPVVLKYVPNSSGTTLTGTITSAGAPLAGVRVSVVDSEGIAHSTAYTDENGVYNILVTDTASQIKYYSGSQNLTDGSLIITRDYTGGMSGDLTVQKTTGSGIFVDSDGNEISDRLRTAIQANATMTLEGKTSGRDAYTVTLTDGRFSWDEALNVVPDVYTVKLTADEGKVSYITDGTITVHPGDNVTAGVNNGLKVKLDSYAITLNLIDDAGASWQSGINMTLIDLVSGAEYPSLITADDGTIEVDLVAGTYTYEFTDNFATSTEPFTVSSSSATTFTVKAHEATSQTFVMSSAAANKVVTIYNTGYQNTVTADGSGNAVIKLPNGTGPVSYTAYTIVGDKGYVAKTGSLTAVECSIEVTGKLLDKNGEVTSGTILFISDDGYQIPVSAKSDGTYKVYLKSGDYTVYANNSGSQVSITRYNTADTTKDFTLQDGKKVSGHTYWYSSSNSMPYVPITVTNIDGCAAECTFTVVSDNSGSYGFYIPSESMCDLTATCAEPYYYTTAGTHTDSQTGVTSSANFTAMANVIKVTNNTGYKIVFGGTTIEDGADKENVQITSTSVTITVEDDDYYATTKFVTTPGMGDQILTDAIFDASTDYHMYKVNGVADTDTVNVEALDEGDFISEGISDNTRKYFLQDGKEFLFTIKNSDSSKIMYKKVTMGTTPDLTVVLSDAATVEGYVGLSESGTITVDYTDTAESFEFDFTSGRYSILVPADKNLRLTPTIVNESESVTYTYTYTAPGALEPGIAIGASTLSTTQSNVYNFAVTSETGAGTADITGELTVTSMSEDALAKVGFSVTFTNSAATPVSTTYVLTGGSAWNNVTFYSDPSMTTEISTVTFTDTATVYGLGTIVKSKVAFADEDMSVILTDINGKTACTSKVKEDITTYWKATTPTAETTKVSVQTNTMGDSEYKYALTLVNEDNFTKTYTLELTGESLADKWFVTYVYGEEINTDGVIEVKGYTTATVYVKITYNTHAEAPTLPTELKVKVTVAGVTDISTDTEESVTVTGNVANATSKTSDSTLTIDGNSASGRGALDSKSEMPTYIWVIMAAIIAALFLIIWMASKRGVFTRKK